MMDDVLISNRELQLAHTRSHDQEPAMLTRRPVPPVLLRSALRTLISQGSTNQQPFVSHIRKRLQESPPAFTSPNELFPKAGVVSQACAEYIASTRCIFSSKLATEALP